MTLGRLALRGLTHYWRTNLATVLGLAVASGVLAGAIAVGDSVRISLRELAMARIGQTSHAVVSNGFFREDLGGGAPVIAMEGVVTHDPSGRRASKVAVYGADARFFEFHRIGRQPPKGSEVWLSPALADELQAGENDQMLVRMPRVSAIPTESLHGAKDDPGRTIRGRFAGVVPATGMGEFSLRPTQGDVRAVFVPLARLQRELDVRNRVNTILLAEAVDLQSQYRLEDVGLHLRGRMLESDSIIFPDPTVEAVKRVDATAQPILTYLGNSFKANGREVPYSLIAAMDHPDLPDDNSVVLNEWMRKELAAKVGDTVEIAYYLWDPSGRLLTKSASFRISGFTPVDPTDKELAPTYPGISGAENMSDWDPPFPMDLKKIRPQDEAYWNQYRATPKAYIRLAAGQKLWRTRYGAVTSIRVPNGFDLSKLRSSLDPTAAGLTQIPVREQALAASGGSTDFGEYFLYFSFFLIVSAILLAGLFFRFGLEQRAAEIATLRAVGFRGGLLRRLYLTEGVVLALAGGLLGMLGAAVYGGLILTGLGTWWVDAVGTRELQFHLTPGAMLAAPLAGLIIGPLVIWLSLRAVLRRSVRDTALPRRGLGWLWGAMLAGAGLTLLFVGGPGGFFGAGALLLAGSLFGLSWWLRGTPGAVKSIAALGVRYTAHHPGRSVLCVALIASSAFLVVSVEAFRRDSSTGLPGWRFYGETAIPVYHDPNTPAGREALNLGAAPTAKWQPMRLRPGDDASCLNLYAPRNPRVLGALSGNLPAQTDGTIPAAVDANTLQYVLHKKLGDTVEVGGAKLKIVEALHDSIFQSEILISDADFQRAFPDEGGFRVFLVETESANEGALESALSDYGLDLQTTAARLAGFHRVENTYLSTFQSLGGLGLVLGTVGLAAILLRNVLERRRQLALLRAVGFGESALLRMTFAESVFLLAAGLAVGVVCALITVVPTVSERGGSVPFRSVLLLIVAVFVTGAVSALLAVRAVHSAPLLDSLRSE